MSFDAEDRSRTFDLRIQALLRDTNAPGLRVRVTAAGAKSYVFEAKLKRQTIRRTIGHEAAAPGRVDAAAAGID